MDEKGTFKITKKSDIDVAKKWTFKTEIESDTGYGRKVDLQNQGESQGAHPLTLKPNQTLRP